MRIPSGVTDQYIYFVAVDATDFTTRETGLSSFTVYRSRNGGAAAAMTTPTINEVDSSNMSGVYELLLDEDMTIDSGDDSQEMVFHITHAGMAPVTRTIELYRPKITAGETLVVSSTTLATGTHNPQSGDAYARLGAPAGASTAADIAAVKGDTAAILLDTGTDGVVVAAASKSGYTLTQSFPTNFATLLINASGHVSRVTLVDTTTTNTDMRGTDGAYTGTPPTAGAIADAVLDEATADHATAGTLGKAVSDTLADTDAIQQDWANGGRLDLILDAVLAELTSAAEPGQGNPPATTTRGAKIDYLYKWARNKTTQTSTTRSHYNDAGDTVDQKSTVSDDNTTFTRGEIVTGP